MKALIALAALVVLAAPAVPQTSVAVVDTAARAKFHHSRPQEVDGLAAVNRFVNGAIQSTSDKEHYGVADLWVMYPGDAKGDCEDFTLTKLGLLGSAGFDIIGRAKIVTVVVRYDGSRHGHALLAVRLSGGDVAYLDNRFPELMTRKELMRAGYQFFDWRA